MLRRSISSNGYLFVTLSKDGESKMFCIHRLVMETFNPIKNMEMMDVNHIDEDITHNQLDNL